MIDKKTLIGRWDIIAWEQRYDDGRVQRPMGEHLQGFIRYTAEGDMICMISKAERPAFKTGGQWDASDSEKAQAYQSILAYAGTFELEGDQVTHHVDISLFPNWRGGAQKRRLELQADGSLAITARLEDGTPQARTALLLWRRHQD